MASRILDDALKKAETARDKEEKVQRDRDLAWEKRVRDWKSNEEALSGEKRALSVEIFAWANGFTQTPEYKRIVDFLDGYIRFQEGYVTIFGSGWGHELPQYSENPERPSLHSPPYHSEILLGRDGTLTYKYGYKWMPGSETALRSAEELASNLSHAYLKELHAAINSDKVQERIAKELQLFEKTACFRPRKR